MESFKLIIKKNFTLYILLLLVFRTLKKIQKIPLVVIEFIICFSYYGSIKPLMACDLTVGITRLVRNRLSLPHPVGIVIGKNVQIGVGCTIYQNVTIGTKAGSGDKYPTIKDRSTIFSNVVIIGDVTIGKNSIVGSGSLVNSDVPDNCVVVGCPAKVIRFLN